MTGEKILTLENVCAGGAIIWGLFVANPLSCMFDKNPRLYAPMASITTNEVFWGMLYIGLGVATLICSWTKHQKWSALLIGAVYISLSMLFFMGDPESAGWGFFGFFGIANFLHWWGFKWKSGMGLNG